MSGLFGAHWEIRNARGVLSWSVKVKDHLGDLDIDEKSILR